MRHETLPKPFPVDEVEIIALYLNQTELDYLATMAGCTAGPTGVALRILDGLTAAGGRSGRQEGSLFKQIGHNHTAIGLKEE